MVEVNSSGNMAAITTLKSFIVRERGDGEGFIRFASVCQKKARGNGFDLQNIFCLLSSVYTSETVFLVMCDPSMNEL